MPTLTNNREALQYMPEGGSIINVGSIQAYQPSASILDYASTKGAITAFTKGLAEELIDRGIRVNCVAPGTMNQPSNNQTLKINTYRSRLDAVDSTVVPC